MSDISKITLPNNEEYNFKDNEARNSILTKYEKPSTGIPKTDLANDVQTSLGKADTALQAGALPAGGTDGDVLVKNGATDYDGRWTNTPPQMGSLAVINQTNAAETTYNIGDYLVYNGQLYRATKSISQSTTLDTGPNGNIIPVTATYDIGVIGEKIVFEQIVASGYITASGNYVDFCVPLKAKRGLNLSINLPPTFMVITPSARYDNEIQSIVQLASRHGDTALILEAQFTSTKPSNQMCTVSVLGLEISAT